MLRSRTGFQVTRLLSCVQLRVKESQASRNHFALPQSQCCRHFSSNICKALYSASSTEPTKTASNEEASHFREGSVTHPFDKESKNLTDLDKEGFKPTKANYTLPHPIWSDEELYDVKITHYKPQTKVDWAAYACVQTMRVAFDLISFYKIGTMDESKWLTRIILLESVAGVPGMVGAMTRHFHSLRRLARDHGWIHTLLEEAENERMHLLTAMNLKQPGALFRGSVLLLQGVFVNLFFLAYLISPRFCHRFVGYLEEEAVKTYTYCLECIDKGKLPMWQQLQAPDIAKIYWKLPNDSMMRDVILAIRADEAHHRTVNHTFGSLKENQQNPYGPGE